MLFVVGLVGEWANAMDTFSQVLVATLLTVIVGFVMGVWAAESRRVSRILRPINDVLQTLPQLVYIIPFIYLMPVSGVPGVVASVLYASPVMIRLVQRGIEGVSPESVEAATSFGATRLQVLLKVKIPLARDAIMLGVNQGIIMVLAVVVIGGLVGSGALGYEVATGLQRNAVRAGRGRVGRDPRARHRTRPRHPGTGTREETGVNANHRGGTDVGSGQREPQGCAVAAGARRRHGAAVMAVGTAGAAKASCGTVTLNEQAWAGSTANTYVAKDVLERTSAAR